MVEAASVALSLPRWGEGAGDEISGPRGGWGRGVRARLRLVARSRHYAGRHFLSGPGEERRGASALSFGFSTLVIRLLLIPGTVAGGEACVRSAALPYLVI